MMTTATHSCAHCGDPVVQQPAGHWQHVHEYGNGSRVAERWGPGDYLTYLNRCQHTVRYGQDAEPGTPLPPVRPGEPNVSGGH